MDLERMKTIISNRKLVHQEFVDKCLVAERYFYCLNDILTLNRPTENDKNPLRHSVHRIPSKFYHTIVNQSASYMFGKPPSFDLGNESDNKKLKEVLGPDFAKNCKKLSINASNCVTAWAHLWLVDKEGEATSEENGSEIEYGVVDPKEIHPVWGNTLNKDLLAVMRNYEFYDTDGYAWDVYEWWDKEFCYSFRKKKGDTVENLEKFNRYRYFSTDINDYDETNVYKHGFDEVPFICFKNNDYGMNDLQGIKEKIDTYDETVSGFADDLEDIQQVIYILSGYGAEPPKDFLERVKQTKLIKISANDQDKPSVDTLSIDIPTEARQLNMELTRRQIFEQGGGVDTTAEVYAYTSGEAMKYMYALLELKVSVKEDEFRNGFSRMIRMICKHYNMNYPKGGPKQTWQRNRINNDTELVQNSLACLGITSRKTALSINPYVEDVDEELKLLDEEKTELAQEIPNMNLVRNQSGRGVVNEQQQQQQQQQQQRSERT